MGCFKEVRLRIGTDVAPVSNHGAVGVVGLDVPQIIDVMHACLRQVKGVYDTAYPADGVQFVPVVVCALQCTISVRRGFPVIALSHPATPSTCHAADFYRLGIEAEDSFAPIHFIDEPLRILSQSRAVDVRLSLHSCGI